jgi:serine/threonine protein kinase/Tfp pilus assembly protein PilF
VSIQCPSCRFNNPDDSNFCAKCSTALDPNKFSAAPSTKTYDIRTQGLKTGSLVAGRYEIIEGLGEGGMGKVYKAYDLEVHEEIALKMIRPEIAANSGIVLRFQNELKLTRKIAHRNVCRMFDLGKEGPDLFITMEYVPGEDLKTTIHRIGPMNVRKTLAIGKQICQGLSEAHGQGVIHRDLKPGNIIIDREGNVRILDFGIALSRETEGATDAGVVPGTFRYIAPELLGGAKPSASSDLFSLGVILYEMVTGRLPFEKEPAPGTAGRHSSGVLKEPTMFNHEIPAALSRLILKCLDHDPAKRIHKAEEVCAELSRIEEALPALEEESWLNRLGEKIRSKPGRAWTAGVGLLLAVIAGVLIFGRKSPLPPPPTAKSLIVLPFKHLKMKEGQESIAPTALSQIIRKLDRSPGFKVISYEISSRYKDTALADDEIAKKHDVANILKGTITSTADGIDIDIQLRRPQTGEILLSESYPTRTEKDVQNALDIIVGNVSKKLGAKIVPEPAKPVPGDPNAKKYYSYALHLQKEYFQSNRPEDFKSCIGYYQRALDFEPGSAIIYWQLGSVYETKYNRDKEESDEKLMVKYWEQAYALDPDLAEANLAKGWVLFNREEHEQAAAFFKRAIELDVNSAEVNFNVGSFLRSLGLYVQARNHYTKALALDPVPDDFAVWHQLLADCDSQLGEVRAATDLLRTAMELNIDFHITLDFAVCLLKMRDYAEAQRQISTADQQGADEGKTRRHKALWHAAMGHQEQALALMKNETNASSQFFSSIYALLGMKDQALQGIRAALGSRGFFQHRWYPYSYLVLKNNPFFDNLRSDAGFQSILQEEERLYNERVRKFGDL